MAGQVRRKCKLLKIVETERRSGVRRRELRVRVAPRAPGERRSRLRKYADVPHTDSVGVAAAIPTPGRRRQLPASTHSVDRPAPWHITVFETLARLAPWPWATSGHSARSCRCFG